MMYQTFTDLPHTIALLANDIAVTFDENYNEVVEIINMLSWYINVR